MNLSSTTLETLIHSKDYRTFLKKAFSIEEETGGFTYAGFARKAGISSRSFPRDVSLGKKRLTASSALSFAEGLKLRGDLKQFFLLLVEVEGDGIASTPVLLAKAKKQLAQIKARLSETKPQRKNELKLLIQSKHWFEVYAALGTQERGATVTDIEKRTQLSSSVILKTLNLLIAEGIARNEPTLRRYFPNEPHIIMNRLGSENGFKNLYLDSLKQVEKCANQKFESKEELFFNSAFSIQSTKMAEFRHELRELILRFVDQTEYAEGDTIAKLVVGFTKA